MVHATINFPICALRRVHTYNRPTFMSKNTNTNTVHVRIANLRNLSRFQAETALAFALVPADVNPETAEKFVLSIRARLSHLASLSADKAEIKRVGKVGKDGDVKVSFTAESVKVKEDTASRLARIVKSAAQFAKDCGTTELPSVAQSADIRATVAAWCKEHAAASETIGGNANDIIDVEEVKLQDEPATNPPALA